MTFPAGVFTRLGYPTWNWRLVTDSDSDDDDDLVCLEDAIESIQPVLRCTLESAEKFDEADCSARVLNFLSATGRDMNDDDSVQFELRRLVLNEKILHRCGFFYRHRLDLILDHFFKRARAGDVLIRVSLTDPGFLYSLSVRGVSTLFHFRIHYQRGWFTLYEDFDQVMNPLNGFETVTDMIEYYRRFSSVHGRFSFRRPYRYRLPQLKHLCLRRVAMVLKMSPRAISMLAVSGLGLPDDLAEEVKENAFPLECVRGRMRADSMKTEGQEK